MYATVADMIDRFGATEMLRLSSVDGPLPETVQEPTVLRAIADVSAVIDTFLRARYLVPLTPPGADIVRAACVLARYDLAMGGDREPSDQMARDRDQVMAWLRKIADGDVLVDQAAPTAPVGSGARTADRVPMYVSGRGL